MGRGRVDSVRATSREGDIIRRHRGIVIIVGIAVVVVERAIGTGHQGTIGRIVEVLGLFAHAVVTRILQASFDTSLTWSLVTY